MSRRPAWPRPRRLTPTSRAADPSPRGRQRGLGRHGRPDSELYRGAPGSGGRVKRPEPPDFNPVESVCRAEALHREQRPPRTAPAKNPCQQSCGPPPGGRRPRRGHRRRAPAVRQADRADRTAGQAEQSAAAAAEAAIATDARRVGAQALVTDNIDESLLMAAAGVQLDDSRTPGPTSRRSPRIGTDRRESAPSRWSPSTPASTVARSWPSATRSAVGLYAPPRSPHSDCSRPAIDPEVPTGWHHVGHGRQPLQPQRPPS
jgi:hypothetical protein